MCALSHVWMRVTLSDTAATCTDMQNCSKKTTPAACREIETCSSANESACTHRRSYQPQPSPLRIRQAVMPFIKAIRHAREWCEPTARSFNHAHDKSNSRVARPVCYVDTRSREPASDLVTFQLAVTRSRSGARQGEDTRTAHHNPIGHFAVPGCMHCLRTQSDGGRHTSPSTARPH